MTGATTLQPRPATISHALQGQGHGGREVSRAAGEERFVLVGGGPMAAISALFGLCPSACLCLSTILHLAAGNTLPPLINSADHRAFLIFRGLLHRKSFPGTRPREPFIRPSMFKVNFFMCCLCDKLNRLAMVYSADSNAQRRRRRKRGKWRPHTGDRTTNTLLG